MTAVAKIQELLGGETVTGHLASELDVVRLVRRGLPPVAVENFLSATRLQYPAIEAYVMPRRTFNRRRDAGQMLEPAESDRLVRMARLVAAAEETIGDRDRAMIWLERPNRALEGEAPLSLADTDLGAQGVERLLGQIAHGLAA
ncbi:antitoxin Xre/MbcA/ParS toxin-binding domain-containing protein [Phenylobacterium sp.]|uniref:type II RES/Xre toxin-antitoxin system antitoxin n=1 Tax=Phenylobacterium sp. TaxID=1871053 RepID=UPI0035B05F5B